MSTPAAQDPDIPVLSFSRLGQGWDRFWFQPADPIVLGLIRICAGLVIFYVHLAYSYDLQEIFGAEGWINLETFQEYRTEVPWPRLPDHWDEVTKQKPSAAERHFMLRWDGARPEPGTTQGLYSWSIWFQVTDPSWMRRVHAVNLLIFFLFAIGFCTRITSVLAWLAALSYLNRSLTTWFGLDAIISLSLFYLMIGPSGAALSVDRLVRRYAKAWKALRSRGSSRKSGLARAEDTLLAPRPLVSANLALRLFQIHLCIVYLASGLSKLQGPAWWNGTAVWQTVACPEFSPLNYRFYYYFLVFLCNHRWLWEIVISGGVLFTLFFEIGFPFLVWNRWLRWTMVLAAVLLHTGIALTMGLTCFSLIMLTVVLSFVPAAAVHGLLDKLGRGPGGFQLVYSSKLRRQVRAASIVGALDVWGQVQLVDRSAPTRGGHEAPTPEDHSGSEPEGHRLQLIAENGAVRTGYPMVERLVRSLRLLWPLALLSWIPGVSILGQILSRDHDSQAAFNSETKGEKRSTQGEKVAR